MELSFILCVSSFKQFVHRKTDRKHLALGLRHFATLECFQSLLLFIDDNKLWYDQAGLQTKTYCIFRSNQ